MKKVATEVSERSKAEPLNCIRLRKKLSERISKTKKDYILSESLF